MSTATSTILGVVTAVIPEIGGLVSAIQALRQKYPALTAAQIQVLVSEITAQADTAFDDVLTKVAADQKGS